MERYAVFLDIDGTLYDHGFLPERNVTAIRRAQALGHLFFLNTGRALAHVPAAVRQKIPFDGFVCGLGTYVRLGDEVLLNRAVPPEICRRAAEMMLQIHGTGRLQGDTMVFHVGRPGEDGIWLRSAEELDRYPDFRCNKITFDGRPPEWCMRELEKYFKIYSFPDYTETAVMGYDKAGGMRLVLERLGIPREKSVAIGDSANDEEMLRYAGVSVAMGDGEEQIRKLCGFVTGPCREGGVGEFVERFFLDRDPPENN